MFLTNFKRVFKRHRETTELSLQGITNLRMNMKSTVSLLVGHTQLMLIC